MKKFKKDRLHFSGRIWDLHPLERAHGAQTRKKGLSFQL